MPLLVALGGEIDHLVKFVHGFLAGLAICNDFYSVVQTELVVDGFPAVPHFVIFLSVFKRFVQGLSACDWFSCWDEYLILAACRVSDSDAERLDLEGEAEL